MIVTDGFIDSILREMGVDVDKKKPPQWLKHYHKSNAGFKYENGYICSWCGKHSHYKKETCDGCKSFMTSAKAKEGEDDGKVY